MNWDEAASYIFRKLVSSSSPSIPNNEYQIQIHNFFNRSNNEYVIFNTSDWAKFYNTDKYFTLFLRYKGAIVAEAARGK